MRRPQFSLKTMLWLAVVVAAFFGGAAWQRRQYAEDRKHWEWRDDNFTHVLLGRREEIDRLKAELAEAKR